MANTKYNTKSTKCGGCGKSIPVKKAKKHNCPAKGKKK